MSDVNKVILVGHIGKVPEFRSLDGGIPVLTFPLATTEIITKNGTRIEHTEWHNIVMWRTLAEVAVRLLEKNALLYVEGKVRTRNFVGKDGIKRYTTEIIAEQFSLLSQANDSKELDISKSLVK